MPRKKKSSSSTAARKSSSSLSRSLSMDETTHPQSPNIEPPHHDDLPQNPNSSLSDPQTQIPPEEKDKETPLMDPQNPISIDEDDDEQDLNSQLEHTDQNPYPKTDDKKPHSFDIQSIDDSMRVDEPPQTENNDKGVNLDRDVSDVNKEDEGVKQIEIETEEEQVQGTTLVDDQPDLTNVSRRANKRKKRQQKGGEKKLKQIQDPISIEEEDDDKESSKEAPTTGLIQSEDKKLKSIEEEKEEDLDLEEEKKPQPETPPHQPHCTEQVADLESEEFRQKKEDDEKHAEQQGGGEEEAKLNNQDDEPQGMSLSPPLPVPPSDEGLMLGLVLDNQPSAPNTNRRGGKRKKPNPRQRAALEKKLKIVKQNLQPIPFVPAKKLDFSKHEELFKRLGLWDFVNLEFDQNIRSDLLATLIATYNPNCVPRYGIVNNCRIKLSRADLARALKLPVKKDKTTTLETSDFDMEELPEESILFLGEFMSNWILLHDDTWILPEEVLNWESLIKKGQPHKVDWPGLIWYMVEKELSQAPEIGNLYYASHLQCLMKSQKDDLFKEEAKLGLQEEAKLTVSTDDEEDAVDPKMGGMEDYQQQDLENQQTELCLGLDKNESEQVYREEVDMDYQEYRQEPGGSAQWLLDGKNNFTDHCLRRCNLNETLNLESQQMMQEHNDDTYDPQSKCSEMEGLTSTDLLQAVGTTNITYSPGLRLRGNSSGDYFQAAHLNPGGMPMFANDYKREISHDEFAENHTLRGHHVRSDESSEFNFHMEQIYNSMNKVREIYEEKKARLNAGMNDDLLVSELQQQNSDLQHQCSHFQQQNALLIDTVQKSQYELQRKNVHNYRLEKELLVMKRLLESYRKALHENRRAFTAYRELNPKPEEPLYRDVGPGGIVLSTKELEKLQLERQEEEKLQRRVIEQMMEDFESDRFEKFESFKNVVLDLDFKLLECEEKFKLCKETIRKGKIAEI